jgi:hypothetical protein
LWIARWRGELALLVLAIAMLAKGLHLPPPVGQTVEIVGQVRAVPGSDAHRRAFAVGREQFTVDQRDMLYDAIGQAIDDGVERALVVWPNAGWPASQPEIVAVRVRTSSQLHREVNGTLNGAWFVSIVFLSLGMGLALLVVSRLSREARPMVEQRREAELAEQVPKAGSVGEERCFGAAITALGLTLVVGPFVLMTGHLAGWLSRILALVPFFGLYAFIVGSHRLVFGRPLTVHDRPMRRLGWGVGMTTLLVIMGVGIYLAVAYALATRGGAPSQ